MSTILEALVEITCNFVGAYIRWNLSFRRKKMDYFLETQQQTKNMILGIFFWIGLIYMIAKTVWPEKF